MNSSSDAAESVVRMSMQGIEVAAKITGSGAKNIAAILYAILKDKQQTKGKTTLTKMLKTNKELKVFSVKEDDLKKFMEEAKRYGVLFTALVSKKHKNIDGMVDIMVKAEDAAKINRIVSRFNLATVDTASVKNEIIKSKNMKVSDKNEKTGVDLVNPSLAKTEKSPLLKPLSKNKKISLDKGAKKDRESVRIKLNKIKKTLNKKSILDDSKEIKSNSIDKRISHQQPKLNRKKRSKGER